MDFNTLQTDADSFAQVADLSIIGELAARQLDIIDEIDELEKNLAVAKDKLRQVAEVDLPEAMLSCGVSEFKTPTGARISVKPYYSASISDENKSSCMIWLKDHGHDDIIKNTVTLSFGKGEDDQARAAVETLAAVGYSPVNTKAVHPQTLKAFVKEQVEAGEDFPLELFKVYVGKRATIK
jgi:hypothetical protein